MKPASLFVTIVVLGLVGLAACQDKEPAQPTAPKPATADKPSPPSSSGEFDRSILGAFKPLPADWSDAKLPADVAQKRVELGRTLYYEARLSKNHDVSCNSCHALDAYGVDGEATSPGHKAQRGGRNSPTTYNAAGHLAQFWDGRAKDVEEQALGPILNPVEMALPNEKAALAVLESMPEYKAMFAAAFPDDKEPLSWANVGQAIGAFERKLATPSRFDAFLKGDDKALTEAEKEGLKTYVSTGCTTCHLGEGVGGSMYQKLGLVKPWPRLDDEGRFEVTKTATDKHFFKVPSLRNIEKTGPYFHDGKTADLSEAVRLMARYQLGRELDDKAVGQIVTFLGSLTGELPTELIKKPELPKSSKSTPPPDPS